MYQDLLNFRQLAVGYILTDTYVFFPLRNDTMLQWATRVVSSDISNSGSL